MWPKWLADTLDRSTPYMRSKGGARSPSQNVDDSPRVIDPEAIDWDEASGFDLHAGYGAERADT